MPKRIIPEHPGVLLQEELEDRKLSINALAMALRVPATRIHAIVHAKRGISADTSARLGRYFGAAPDFWLKVQMHYDMAMLDEKRIAAEVKPEKSAA